MTEQPRSGLSGSRGPFLRPSRWMGCSVICSVGLAQAHAWVGQRAKSRSSSGAPFSSTEFRCLWHNGCWRLPDNPRDAGDVADDLPA
jgi:hypothetical protein